MKTVAGQNNLLITWRPVADGAELTRVETTDRDVVLPETIQGLPVTALSRLAFDTTEEPPEGERLRITCGPGGTETDNQRLKRITLPQTLRRVGDYAFYNCLRLREARFLSEVEHWGIDVFMNCRMLDTFFVRAADERAESVYHFASAFSRELDITVEYPEGPPARLIFPGYSEAYQENISARCFFYEVQGPGYPYHSMFKRRALELKDYDRLWPALLATEHDPDCALRMAWYRLEFPRGLTPETTAQYLDFLRRNADRVLEWLLGRRDMRGLAWFLPQAQAGQETLRTACEAARKLGAAEALALLLEEQHRRFERGAQKTFVL